MDPNSFELNPGSQNLDVDTASQVIRIDSAILEQNDLVAAQNRKNLSDRNIFTLNLISSPGSGKTTLLVETIKCLKESIRCAVIEGDQQTDLDALRIAETGIPVVQINTSQSCHLNAAFIEEALARLPLDNIDLLFIENVGNLICPAEYDLGESEKVIIMSITEGEEKPLKYPLIFHLADVMVLTKMDLLPWLRFDLDKCKLNVRHIHPGLQIIETSAYTSEGMSLWLSYLQQKVHKDSY
jgi:hydrogenase nickel incorporation protein HypB